MNRSFGIITGVCILSSNGMANYSGNYTKKKKEENKTNLILVFSDNKSIKFNDEKLIGFKA